LHIDVVARVPADERITLAIEHLSLTEALQHLRPYVNSLVVVDGKAPDTIRKLIVISKRLVGEPARPSTHAVDASALAQPQQSDVSTPAAPARPKPFRFEFDPTALGQRGQ
jgi:hypothetical protein